VHHYWQNSDASSAFDFARDSGFVDDFVAHDAAAWVSQGAPFKQRQPQGHALFYADFGTAGDSAATVLDLSTVRAKGWLAKHNGAEIENPLGGGTELVDLGKPGVSDAYVSSLERKWGRRGWDGVFADDVNAWFSLWSTDSIDGYKSPLDYWRRAVLPLLEQVDRRLAADKGGILVPNVGEWLAHPELNDVLRVADGALQEFFLVGGDGASLDPSQIENEYVSLRAAARSGKTYYAIVHRTDAQGLKYAFCATAIMAGARADLVRLTNQSTSGSEPLTWNPVFGRHLGAPAGPIHHEHGSTQWARAFANGRTLTIDTDGQSCTGL
jgi:hypothetical protein